MNVFRMKTLVLVCLLFSNACTTKAQLFEDSFSKTAKFNNGSRQKVLIIDNINGHVTVTGKQTDQVTVDVEQLITGDTEQDVTEGKSDLKLVVEEQEDTIFVYIDSPFIHRNKEGRHYGRSWQQAHRVDYEFRYDLKVTTPADVDLFVATINKGDVKVNGIYANKMRAYNVNGDVMLSDVTGQTKATTVNGVVEVTYKENPTGDCKYSTINGTIKVNYLKNLSADLKFKSMHGDFFTDFEVKSYVPTKVAKEESKEGIRLVVDKYTNVRVGKGNYVHRFETLNGDIYIKRN